MLVIVSKRLARPRTNFKSSDNLASGKFKTEAESACARECIQNIQDFAFLPLLPFTR